MDDKNSIFQNILGSGLLGIPGMIASGNNPLQGGLLGPLLFGNQQNSQNNRPLIQPMMPYGLGRWGSHSGSYGNEEFDNIITPWGEVPRAKRPPMPGDRGYSGAR